MKRIIALLAPTVLAIGIVAGTASATHTESISDPTIHFAQGDPVVDIVDKDGAGALFLSTPASSDKAQVLVDGFATNLDSLASLSYRTFRDQGTGEQVASINIVTIPWTGTYVYEPVYDTSAAVVDGEWQEWDAFSDTARWWHTDDPNTFVTWEEIIEDVGGLEALAVLVNQGSGNPELMSYVDWVEVDGHTYDFAPVVTKDDCKDGGWEDLEFRNQGQCIRYVNTGHDSRE
jgi:hypothetical protein